METCEVCSATVSELRRGRCWGCYGRWAAARPVGVGAACCMCGDRRRGFLRSVELLATFVPICHNCCGRALALEPMPQSLGEIRIVLRRDRRLAPRRFGKADTRVYPRDRRDQDRRSGRAPNVAAEVDDDAIIAELVADLEALAVEDAPLHDGLDAVELTQIREDPHKRPRRAADGR
jgi:hypothetical protein